MFFTPVKIGLIFKSFHVFSFKPQEKVSTLSNGAVFCANGNQTFVCCNYRKMIMGLVASCLGFLKPISNIQHIFMHNILHHWVAFKILFTVPLLVMASLVFHKLRGDFYD